MRARCSAAYKRSLAALGGCAALDAACAPCTLRLLRDGDHHRGCLSRRGNAFGWRRTPVWYDGPGCSGRAAVDADRVGPWAGRHVGVVEYATATLYLSEPDPAVQPFAAQSVRDADGACKAGSAAGDFITVAPTGIDLDERFAEPFWLEVRRIG